MNRTVNRVVEILDLISQSPNGLTLPELVEATNYPKTSVYDILRELEDKSMIYRRDVPANSFSIGFRAFAIGNSYCSNSHLLENANMEIQKLGSKLNKSILLGKPYRKSCLYVGQYQPKDSILRLPNIGEKEDQDKNAMGWLFQALLNQTITSALLSDIRRKGYAIYGTDKDSIVYSIAAPIKNFENRLSGAIMLTDVNIQNKNIESEIKAVCECAETISQKLGYCIK